MKVMVIGIDGGTFDLIEPWIDEGKLPNLKKLKGAGIYSDLITTFPPLTGPAWVSLMTGCNPGKHGVFDFLAPEIGKIRIHNSKSIKVPTLWKLLSDNGVKVAVVNVPMTYPPSRVNGYMITSIMSGKGNISYPKNLRKEIEKSIGRKYKIGINIPPQKGNEQSHINDMYEWHDSISKTAFYLLNTKKSDFFMVVFPITDVASHVYYKYMEKGGKFGNEILKAYQTVDETIGKLLEFTDSKTNVILVSDHGFGPLRGMVNINNFLIERKYIKFRKNARYKATLFKLGLTPRNIFNLLKKIKLGKLARGVSIETRSKTLERFLGFKDLDMNKTLAYSKGHVGQIHINTKALKKQMIDYTKFRKHLIDDLYKLKVPYTDDVMTSKILIREEMYKGPYVNQGADLGIIFNNFEYIAYPLFAADNKIVTKHILLRSGAHRMNGMFLGYGPFWKKQGRIEARSIMDIVPTVLKIFGIDKPYYMDGNIIDPDT